ncbi:hypothetical protein VFPBJ_06292 [Purpureocillium lilacinum]|uniref:Fungal specific transcription factor domain-containing protein n=2 Tax=Purpureocillium lilacinum TaxID=33203 RepID=A0A179GRZ4_PURLI|nr:hypothetical protein VFPBJ_06292 [Purpureocillium lilacinum]
MFGGTSSGSDSVQHPSRARASTAARGMSQKTQERPRHASLSCLEFIEETRKFYLRGTKKTEAQDHGSHGDTSAIQDADSGTNIVGKNPSTEETGSPSPSIGGHNQPTLEPRGGLGWGGRTPLSNEEEVSHALRAVDDCSDCVSSEAVGQTVATATSGLHQSRNLWNTGSLLRLDTPVRSLAYLTHRDGSGAHQGLTSWPFDSPDEARLMRYYITDISRRFDLCDPERHFALVVPWRAACCPPLLNAAFALSARCLSRTTSYDAFIANRYYQRCLSNLIPMLGDQDALNNQDLFAAIILLRSLEEIEGECFSCVLTLLLSGANG